jgi:hypothetical protein
MLAPPDYLETFRQASLWFGFFQGCVWISKAVSGNLSPTYRKLKTSSEQAYWACSIVSTLHAIIISFAAWDCGWRDGFFSSNDLTLTSNCSSNCLTIFVGYVLSDLCWLLYYYQEWPGTLPMILHHVLAVITYSDLHAQQLGHNITLVVLLFEATTPFVNCRWFLSQMDWKDTKLYVVNGLLMTIGWLIIRVVVGAYVGVWMWRMRAQMAEEARWFTQWISLIGAYTLGYALQWFWFVKIVQGAMKVLTGPKSQKKQK